MSERPYPIHPTHRAILKNVSWELVAPHAAQAEKNHYQTLERLSERGGLSLDELLAVLEDRPWHKVNKTEALDRIRTIAAKRGISLS